MIGIQCHCYTKYDLIATQNRLNILLDKKETLYSEYCGITSPIISDVKVQTGKINNDRTLEYLHQITKTNKKTGMSLEQEIDLTQLEVNKIKHYLNLMETSLKNMVSIEYKLYYAITVVSYPLLKPSIKQVWK